MAAGVLKVRMLGGFSLTYEDNGVDGGASRSHKVWSLLAYLICKRGRAIAQEELARALWGEEKDDGSGGALKTTVWRARSALDPLFPGAGRELILRGDDGYSWNTGVRLQLDAEDFEALCRAGNAAQDEDQRLDAFRGALALYRGDFLGKLSAEAWAMPLAAHYHNLYITTAPEAASLLRAKGLHQEAAELCRAALLIEPCQETLCQHLMRSLLAMGDRQGAIAAYNEMRERLLSELGVMPTEETQAIYREGVSSETTAGDLMTPDAIRALLREPDPEAGALVCDFGFFKHLYRVEARSAARRGDAIHIGVLTVAGRGGKAVSRRSLERAMENLGALLREKLRRGDVVSRCSSSQYLTMLLQANYENSCMVCERVVRAFARRYPHSPVGIDWSVQPLEPLTGMDGAPPPEEPAPM